MDHPDAATRRINALTDGRLLARNTLWNLAGRVLPIVAALASIPLLLRTLGPDRFGILTLALTFVGYFGLLDFSIGSALTQAISHRIGRGREDEAPGLVCTGVSILLLLSALGVMISTALTPMIIHHVLKVPAPIGQEAITAFYVLALSIPFVIMNAALYGTLAAYQRFDIGNRLGIPFGIAIYVGPVVIVQWFNSLVAVMVVLLCLRAAACVIFAAMCLRVVPGLRLGFRFDRIAARELMTFGGWLTLSGILTPLMTSIDRFVVGSLVSVTAVAFYAAPYEIVTKLRAITVSFMSVLSPAFTARMASTSGNLAVLFRRGLTYLSLVMFSVTIAMVIFAREGLVVWLGGDFANQSTRVLQYLAAGAFFNNLAQVAIGMMASFGRPDIMAKLQLFEVPLYLPVLFGAIVLFGIEGAAAAWAFRMVIESIVVFLVAARFISEIRQTTRTVLLATPMILITFALGGMVESLVWKVAYACVVLSVLIAFAWRVVGPAERQLVLGHMRHLAARLPLRAQRG